MRDDNHMPDAGSGTADWLSWTSQRQSLASDPYRSAWVSANAGSGKTHVLTQRVVRLLLSGCRPSSILCLTYTKAAASEMSNRIFQRLASWATLSDDDLRQRIAEIEGGAPDKGKLANARRLFALALETPGGLKIQTIHAFCEALLHQFPLEANLAGHFSVLDDRATSVLLADARRSLLTATIGEEDSVLAGAFATVLDLADDTGLEKLIGSIIANRTAIRTFVDRAKRHGGVRQTLQTILSLDGDDTDETVLEQFWPLPGLSGSRLARYLQLADEHGGAKVREFAAGLRAVSRMPGAAERYEALLELFFTGTGKPRAESGFLSKAMLTVEPDLANTIRQAIDHIQACRERLNRVRMLEATLSALILADRLNQDYEDLKKERSLLDFDDLINRTAEMLSRGDVSPWVHYKLDQGIDHILVDEAQDTSPTQWAVIQSLTEDFFSGLSSREVNRSMFAVGDEKQSIYSFQGARPERFSQERRVTAKRISDGGKPFSPVDLQLSFRSTGDVLSAVDAVFSNPANARGLSADDVPVIHVSNRIGEPGTVDVWDMIEAEPAASADDWTAAFDSVPEKAPVNVLAKRIAGTLAGWIGKESILEKGKRRLIEPGDVIVLVRKRDSFVNALTRALKRGGNIPVAGADRLVLTKHIAVQDLLALGRFALLQNDDLSLAAILKSPLFNLPEQALFELAGYRAADENLWSALQRLAAAGDGTFADIEKALRDHIDAGRWLSVHDFYARVLGPGGGRRAFLARLGSEASDIIDEFVTLALTYETAGLPGLQAFVSGLEVEAPTIKRELDKERNEVRIMTVHAAKGLEAPIVFLVDGGGKAFSSQHLPPLRLLETANPLGADLPVPVWMPPKTPGNELTTTHSNQVKTATEEEYRRLLYVGMTRAADRLIICGYSGLRRNTATWHQMIRQSLDADDRSTPATFAAVGETWDGLAWRSVKTERQQDAADQQSKVEIAGHKSLPPCLSRALPPQKRLPRPLSPSGAGAVIDDDERDVMVGSALFGDGPKGGGSFQTGVILHRMLQVLPSLHQDQQTEAAERYIERAVPSWPAARRQALVRSALGVLDHPDLAEVFAAGSQPEVAIMGTLKLGNREFAVSGRIDRLSVRGKTVSIADFKTDRTVPASEADVSFPYKAQLAIYRALLQPLYPDHDITCSLIYTEGPEIIRLTADVLDRSLAELATK
ncbi:double-strand break repair helicase AddA [Pararhizobium sp.]|uniref:double-strand break repair helicase AddA n=1 Tax=Pararhizobium sp. TaxID=1977563 RepID=UPI00271A8D69|nr:double-strand break repair helicase AddA [Pararhizobium sp.]MDO9416831.1 double-strand break repair helicase AddA [Pararhizobium sp.]